MKTKTHCTNMIEGLRPLVGDNGWDYCVLWKLSQDQRFLELMGCCCSGSEANRGGMSCPEGVSAKQSPCRDMVAQHTRTRACDALSQLSSSLPLDSSLGIYAQVLISNQPAWLTKAPDSTSPTETGRAKTRVLVPIPGGLVELFVSKLFAEDQHVVHFVMSQYCNNANLSYEEASMGVVDQYQGIGVGIDGNDLGPWIPTMPTDHAGFAWDQNQLYGSPLNLLDGAGPKLGPAGGDHLFGIEHDDVAAAVAYQHSLMTSAGECSMLAGSGGGDNKQESDVKQETAARADSISDGSDEDEDTRPTVGRNGKRHHSKNLVAERKRRKKLNDRLYALRALVPKITKMDRAAILGDAIEYVMELQKQVKDLQDELEDDTNPEDDETKQIGSNCKILEGPNAKGAMSNGMELEESPNSSRMKQAAPEHVNNDDKGNHEMEPQVEVRQVEGNEFFVKVLCEHKAGGFARLMEAMSSLGLEVTNANVTTHRTLVLNVFRVEKRENELLQVDQVRDSLLEITRGPIGGWVEPGGQFPINGGDFGHNRSSNHHQHLLGSQSQLHYLNHHI